MKILQIGTMNWKDDVQNIPEDLEWLFSRVDNLSLFLKEQQEIELSKLPVQDDLVVKPKIKVRFDAILLTDRVRESDLEILSNTIEAYGLYHISGLKLHSEHPQGIFKRKVLRELVTSSNKEETMYYLYLTLFPSQYGAKLKIPEIDVNPNFKGKVTYDGHVSANFSGDFGRHFKPLFTFRYNLSSFPIALELWQEYIKVGLADIRIEILPIRKGSLYDIMGSIILDEKDMQEPFILKPDDEVGFYAVTILAKGSGKLSFGPMHWRYSRMGLGRFVLGGERYNDEKRQEFIYYFNPGDMKPPLNVYFSGFRPAEGFEGFGMMKFLKAPFMLIADPRLEGGSFYSGTIDFEEKIQKVIHDSLDYLGFDSSDLILSGLSMGTFGALYYASHFNPYSVIVGKPFTNVGDTVEGMKLKRPDEFETIADVLLNITGGLKETNIEALNQKFWNKFQQSEYEKTQFAIAYMKNDDYDGLAAIRLLDYLSAKNVHVYAKGYLGRHNDNSSAINKWFMRQYFNLLEKKYGRRYS